MTLNQFYREIMRQVPNADLDHDHRFDNDIDECFLEGMSVEETIESLDLEYHFAPVSDTVGFFPAHDREHWLADRQSRIRDMQR